MAGPPAPQDDARARYMEERAQYIIDQLTRDKEMMARVHAGYQESLRDEGGIMWDDLKRELASQSETPSEGPTIRD